MQDLALFIDDGGVMNDNAIRGRLWQRGVAEFFAPRLGGSPEAWAEANLKIVASELWTMPVARGETYDAWYRRYQIEWLSAMALDVGIQAPSEEDALALAEAAARHITFNCHSAFPDAAPALRELSAQGFVLHTASGEDSHELDGYLTSMGVRHLFSHLYGPDLTGVFKRGPDYYDSAFARSGLDPRHCLVVDDSPSALAWAAAAGALTVLVDRERAHGDGRGVIRHLAELPAFVQRLARV